MHIRTSEETSLALQSRYYSRVKSASTPPDIHVATVSFLTTAHDCMCESQPACHHSADRFQQLYRGSSLEGSGESAPGLVASPPREAARGHP